MPKRKNAAVAPANSAKQPEQLPLLPQGKGTRTKHARGPRLSDGREKERAAKRASTKEREALERFLKRMEWSAEEWEMRRRHYLENPLSDEELRSNLWKVEKIRVSGGPTVERALERQKKLEPDLWMVAFLLAQGDTPKEMKPIMNLERRRIYQLLRRLREIVYEEERSDTDAALARWFLGL